MFLAGLQQCQGDTEKVLFKRELFVFGACTSRKPKNGTRRSKYVQMVFVVVARGFHFRDVFLHLEEVTRWHTNFVQRGSFDFAISGGQKGVGNIGNFMQFHAMSYQYWISWLDA